MMTITYSQYCAISRAISNYNHAAKYVSVEQITLDWFENESLEFGVNWCCLGAQSTEKTTEFIKNLTRANVIAEDLNNMKLVVDEDTFKRTFTEDEKEIIINSRDELVNIFESEAGVEFFAKKVLKRINF